MEKRVRYCDECGCNQEILVKERLAQYTYRKEPFEITERYAECTVCGNDVTDEELDNQTLQQLTKLYETKHMINAEVIKNLRRSYGITQNIFAKLLNRGIASIKRYEGGTSLPDAALIATFKMLKDNPSSILKLYEQNNDLFDEDEIKTLEEKFHNLFPAQDIKESSYRLLELTYKQYEKTINTGYRAFKPEKLFNMILFFARGGVLKTKLMKLLWYSDFLYFKRRDLSITGTPYCHLPYGPVPKNHDLILGCMEGIDFISVTEEDDADGYTRILIKSQKDSSSILFDELEQETLYYVENYFKSFGSRMISEFAHKEKGWIETNDHEIISYIFAKELQLR